MSAVLTGGERHEQIALLHDATVDDDAAQLAVCLAAPENPASRLRDPFRGQAQRVTRPAT